MKQHQNQKKQNEQALIEYYTIHIMSMSKNGTKYTLYSVKKQFKKNYSKNLSMTTLQKQNEEHNP